MGGPLLHLASPRCPCTPGDPQLTAAPALSGCPSSFCQSSAPRWPARQTTSTSQASYIHPTSPRSHQSSSGACPVPVFLPFFHPNDAVRSPGAAHLQVVDGEGVFVHVGGVGAHRDAGDGGQVPAVAAHGLHDEDAALGARRRLLDAVAALLRDKIGDGVTQAEPAGDERGTPRRCPSPPWLR